MLAQAVPPLILSFAFLSLTSAQTDGVLTFWDDKNFKGEKWQFHRSLDAQYCYNDNVGKPSSITWANQIQTGSFNGKAKIAFYTEHDCKCTSRAWFTAEKDFPVTWLNLASTSSFMLWQISHKARRIVHLDDQPDLCT